MSAVLLSINVTVVFCFTAFIHFHYGNWRKHHILVTLTTFVSWYFPFMIVFVMPIDVSSTIYRQCVSDHQEISTVSPVIPYNITSSFGTVNTTGFILSTAVSTEISSLTTVADGSKAACLQPQSYVPETTLAGLWHVVYWTCQALTWLILPMMQSYAAAGDFTVCGKLKSALFENAVIYGSYLLILLVCIIYVAIKPNLHFSIDQMKVLAVTASNTWGLSLLVLLLGFGLIDVPRSCWQNARLRHRLARTYFSLAKMSLEKAEAEETLEDVLDDVKKTSELISHGHVYRQYIDTILLKCPESLQQSAANDGDVSRPTDVMTCRALVRLHRRVITATQRHNCAVLQWRRLMDGALDMEDVALCDLSRHVVIPRVAATHAVFWRWLDNPTIEWYWKCWGYPLCLGLSAVIMGVLSAMVVWSECLFFVRSPTLSLFAVLVNVAKTCYNYHAIEFVCILTIMYLCLCAYYTIFKVRIFSFYYLVSSHLTDENSLIFCGMMLCRLTPPLCLNFLGLIHLDSHVIKDSHIQETAYTHIMGHMDVIGFISDGFNIYFPIAIVLLCAFTIFNIGMRILNVIGMHQFMVDDEITQELVDEGKELVRRERRRSLRHEETDSRRQVMSEKYARQRGTRRANQLASMSDSLLDSDRTELLRVADPVDYSGHTTADFYFTDLVNVEGAEREHPRQPASTSRPQSLPVDRQWPTRPAGRPPKNIFDDI